MVEELDDLVKFAAMVRSSVEDGTLGTGAEIDEFDAVSSRIVEACRWLQYHRADVTVITVPNLVWNELTRLNHVVRNHLYWHDELAVASVNLFSTKSPSSRVEIFVSGDRAESCGQLLAWRDSLLDTSLHLDATDEPGEPRVSVYGRFHDKTAVTVTAPLSTDDLEGMSGVQLGDVVLDWLQKHTA
ncbi:hypothetical protein Aglo01_44970 [Actinokineospora globicatena]|nr:hypothetical protein Aglo01_44970 [Actinokineospora globicatena]GLW86845.1 hypothetical protein Aglo02_44840 [Actinokineospora globicatena]